MTQRNTMRSAAPGRFGIGWLFAVAMLPGLLAGSLLLFTIYKSERAQLEESALQTARALAQAVDRDLAGIRGKLQILAASPSLQAGDIPAFYRQAQDSLATEALAVAIVLSDATGQQVMNTLRPLGTALPKTGHPELLKRTFETGRPSVSDLYIGGVAKTQFVALEVPVIRDGAVVLALDMGIPAERLLPLLVGQKLPEGWVGSLLDTKGVVIARSQNAARFVGQTARADLIEAMARDDEGSMASRTLEGAPSFVAFSRSASTGWTVAVAMTQSVLVGNLYWPLALSALATVAFVAAGATIAGVFSRQLSRALQDLSDATEAAAGGDLEALAPLVGPRQVARLAARFNSMQAARKQAEAELRLAAGVFHQVGEAIMICDQDARIIDVNNAFTELTGYRRDEVVGADPRILKSGRHDAAFFVALRAALDKSGRWQGEIWNRRKDGQLFAGQMTISVVKDARGALSRYIGLFSDVTERSRRQEEIESLAYLDPLTHLPNRRLLGERIRQALSSADRQKTLVAFCSLDLDGFKPINDALGHEAGDLVLVEIARRLQLELRAHDTVTRMGGDEFVLQLINLGARGEVEPVLARVLAAIAAPIGFGDGRRVTVSASIGVALYPEHGRDPGALLKKSDQAMYQAKLAGRNRVLFYDPGRGL